MATVNLSLKNISLPSDAYYILFVNNGFAFPDLSINIANAIKKYRELNDIEMFNKFEKIRKLDTNVSGGFYKIRGNMFYPLYQIVSSEGDFNAVKNNIAIFFPEIKTFDDFIEHNKKLAKKTLDKLFSEDLCYIVVNPKSSDGDFLACDELLPANDSGNNMYTKKAIVYFERVLENGYYI